MPAVHARGGQGNATGLGSGRYPALHRCASRNTSRLASDSRATASSSRTSRRDEIVSSTDSDQNDLKYRGWKAIADALGKSVMTAHKYKVRDRNPLKVERDDHGIYLRQSVLDAWKAAESLTYEQLLPRWKRAS
jgi:hypothetical protein